MIQKRKLTIAYVKVIFAGVVLFVFIFILLANMGKTFGSFTVFGGDIPAPPLGVVMVLSAVCGVFAWKAIKLLYRGAMTIHEYRKEHPVIRPSDELKMQARQAMQSRTDTENPPQDE